MVESNGIEEKEVPLTVYEQIKEGLVEIQNVEMLIDDFKEEKDKDLIQVAVTRLDKLSSTLRVLVRLEEAKNRQNGPLMMKLQTRIDKAVKQILDTTCNVNKSKRSSRSLSLTPQEVSSHSIRDSLHTDVTAHNAHKTSPSRDDMKKRPLQGYLKKQGEKVMKLWSIRWFRQVRHSLHYFGSETSKVKNGCIDFSSMQSVQFPKDPSSCEFQIVTPNRIYKLQALSISELDYWKQGLEYWRKVYPCISLESSVDSELKSSPSAGQVYNFKKMQAMDSVNIPQTRYRSAPLSIHSVGSYGHHGDSPDVNIRSPSGKSTLPETLEEAYSIIQKQQILIQSQQEQIDQFGAREGLTDSEKILKLHQENERLQQELEFKELLLNDFEQNASSLKLESELHKRLSGIPGIEGDENYENRLIQEIQQMEEYLRDSEDREVKYKKDIKNLTEKLKHVESRLQATNETVEQLR